MIGFGSYIVHIGQIEGSVFIVLAIGDIFIVAGIILVILIVVGIIGAALSSKIVLCQVTNNKIQCSPHNLNLQIHEKRIESKENLNYRDPHYINQHGRE